MTTPLTKKMKIKGLHAHPLQSAYYADSTAADDETLAKDLKSRGQQSPVVIMPARNAAGLPAGTILDGHRRARLMAQNGEKEVDVIVRDDLKDADVATVEAEFLKYNFHRRQQHPLDKARVAKRLFEIEKNRTFPEMYQTQRLACRDRVGKAMGMSGRNLDRYVHVLDTPLPIQNAVRDGRLLLIAGAKIALLTKNQQQEIADRIEEMKDKREIARVVGEFVDVPDGSRHHSTGNALATLARAMERTAIDLGDRADKVSPRLAQHFEPVLTEGVRIINEILSQAKSYNKDLETGWTPCLNRKRKNSDLRTPESAKA